MRNKMSILYNDIPRSNETWELQLKQVLCKHLSTSSRHHFKLKIHSTFWQSISEGRHLISNFTCKPRQNDIPHQYPQVPEIFHLDLSLVTESEFSSVCSSAASILSQQHLNVIWATQYNRQMLLSKNRECINICSGGKTNTVFSGQIPAGNLLILTQNVSGAGNMAVQVICSFFTIIFSTPHYSTKRFVQDCYFHHLLHHTTPQSAMFLTTHWNIINALIHLFNVGLVTLLLHNHNTNAVFTVVKKLLKE